MELRRRSHWAAPAHLPARLPRPGIWRGRLCAGSWYKVFCPASPASGTSRLVRGAVWKGEAGENQMQVGPLPAANTNTASRLPAPFSSLPYIPTRPAPSRAAQPASLGLPDVGRVGGPRLASARRTPLRPQLGAGQPTGRPSHTHPGPVTAPRLAHPPRGGGQLPGFCVSCSA